MPEIRFRRFPFFHRYRKLLLTQADANKGEGDVPGSVTGSRAAPLARAVASRHGQRVS